MFVRRKKNLSGSFSVQIVQKVGRINKVVKSIGSSSDAAELDILERVYSKYELDAKWDGLKGYLTNTDLKPNQVIDAYGNLWQIEKAFRISKTDLKIRPIYHRIPERINTHICICFVSYAVFKELERLLKESKVSFSPYRAIELTKNMYQIRIFLPDSKVYTTLPLKPSPEQQELISAILKN